MINFLTGVQSTSSALAAERTRMEVISQNIANANTTRTPEGGPYQRQHVVFENVLNSKVASDGLSGAASVHVARIENDPRGPKMIFNPSHPDANEKGMVAMPNINVHEEMADLIASSRTFEANLAVIKTAKNLAMQSLSIGKR